MMTGQRTQPASKHAQSFQCLTCSRSFASKKARRQHWRDLPSHTPSPLPTKTEAEASYTFPKLHTDIVRQVSDVLEPPSFNHSTSTTNCSKQYSTNVTGKFRCESAGCKKKAWSSGIVAIVIRAYPDNMYNAVVYNQRCKACKRLGFMEIDAETYVERVSYRLKKWAGIGMAPLPWSQNSGPPHQSALCEGCRLGYCRRKVQD